MLIPRNRLAIAVLKVWRLLGNLVMLLRSKMQAIFDFFLDRLCLWLIKTYMSRNPEYQPY